MKIIIATPLYPPEIETLSFYIKSLAAKLCKKHEVTIVAYASTAEKIPGVKLITISKRQPLLMRFLRYLFALLETSKHADIIYVQNSVTAGLPAIIVKFFRKIPVILNFAENEAWKRATQLQFTSQSPENFLKKPKSSSKIRFIIFLQKFVSNHASQITVSSDASAKLLSSVYHVPSTHIKINYNPPENQQILPFKTNPVQHQIIAIGRLVEWAHIPEIIYTVNSLKQKFPDIKLLIAGEGPQENKLKQIVTDLNLSKYIIFLGRISKAENWYLRKISHTHIHLYDSIHENFPDTIISSFSAGIPVIINNSIEADEIISDEENGFTVNLKNEKELSKKITFLFNDDNLKNKIINNANKILNAKFSWESHLKTLNNIFESGYGK
ncbi:MAG TPA: glycosyltransferase family 4 protein [Candidatus Portnoybacteria bacterium]|jgi:glycosyltransferase involved in cell wall biosynthesis|nr:glycosyltransferase family 4 protein [Candidatus Portnoybacteria bacterium]MDD5752319.1 glycosyltransferase family 4 protein [Candidatus Portnoybacteria bacterium]HNU96679.1 glycosyltransferase family 4 protein [Candidatus Portnoybacteria bacterium]HPJ80534.1 glycosyltransferase family 4 protein [Candidatus Portnoybacteria bacterium]